MPLEDDMRDLALRVARIEQTLGIAAAAAPVASSQAAVNAALTGGQLGKVPYLLGRAFLGLAGAYLLRALTEAGTIGHATGIGAGIVYAIGWLVWAARIPAEERAETALHGLTSVLVLCPLLWEATLRFQAVSTWTAAAILLFFILFGLLISWRKNILIVATIATLAGLTTAAALLLATHDVLPFTLLFLAVAAAVETSACLNHWLSERWLAASAADLAVLLATWLVTNARGLPEGYAPYSHAWLLATLITLSTIYLCSTMVRTLLRGFTFTFFESAQCALALAIALNGCLRLSEADARIAPAIGILTLAGAIACYVVSLILPPGRNLYTYSTFAILLTILGMRILLPLHSGAAVWLALAPLCVWAGKFSGRLALEVHGVIYLVLALFFLGTLAQAAAALFANENPQWAIYAAAVAAVLCYRFSSASVLRLTLAAAAAFLLAAILASALTGAYHDVFGAGASHSYCATLRTLVLAGGALSLDWAGRQWHRLELSRLMYPLIALAAYRVLTQDIHEERKAAAMISMLIFGAALMLLSRRKPTQTAA